MLMAACKSQISENNCKANKTTLKEAKRDIQFVPTNSEKDMNALCASYCSHRKLGKC